MQITPGYDFTQHETPTHAKLVTMMNGISITAIDISQVDSTLIGIKVVGSSSASNLAEGWLWNDENNALWVLNDKGWVQIFRANWGGFESKRFVERGLLTDTQGLSGASSVKCHRPGCYLEMTPTPAGDTLATCFGIGLGLQGHRARNLETCFSNVTMPKEVHTVRICHRGGIPTRLNGASRAGTYPDFIMAGGISAIPANSAATYPDGIALRGLYRVVTDDAHYLWHLGPSRAEF